MKIGELPALDLRQKLMGEGLVFRAGCFTARVTSPLEQIAQGIRVLYADHDLQTDTEFSDCHLRIMQSSGLGQLMPRPTRMIVNGKEWHRAERDLPVACLEWGMNWFVFRNANHLLVVHAATLERDGAGLILPAHSGSGKSTFAAALAHSGWRLFSDELALIRPETGELIPQARPICLKGDSIPIIRDFAPEARFGPVGYHRKERRSITHVKPPTNAVERMDETALPSLIVFPKFLSNSPTRLTPVSKSQSFIRVAQTSFNYSKLHRLGFETLHHLIDQCQSYELTYGNLPEAVELVNELASEIAPVAPHA